MTNRHNGKMSTWHALHATLRVLVDMADRKCDFALSTELRRLMRVTAGDEPASEASAPKPEPWTAPTLTVDDVAKLQGGQGAAYSPVKVPGLPPGVPPTSKAAGERAGQFDPHEAEVGGVMGGKPAWWPSKMLWWSSMEAAEADLISLGWKRLSPVVRNRVRPQRRWLWSERVLLRLEEVGIGGAGVRGIIEAQS